MLADALDRSLSLAASMDSRGYARSMPGRSDARITAALLVALLAAAMGTYGMLDATTPGWLGLPLLAAGAVVAVAGSVLAGRRVQRTRYRPDPWGSPETVIAGCGVVAAALLAATSWPGRAVVCALLAAVPAVLPAVRLGPVR